MLWRWPGALKVPPANKQNPSKSPRVTGGSAVLVPSRAPEFHTELILVFVL